MEGRGTAGDSAGVTVQGLCGEMAEVVGEVGRNYNSGVHIELDSFKSRK